MIQWSYWSWFWVMYHYWSSELVTSQLVPEPSLEARLCHEFTWNKRDFTIKSFVFNFIYLILYAARLPSCVLLRLYYLGRVIVVCGHGLMYHAGKLTMSSTLCFAHSPLLSLCVNEPLPVSKPASHASISSCHASLSDPLNTMLWDSIPTSAHVTISLTVKRLNDNNNNDHRIFFQYELSYNCMESAD